MSSSRLPGKVLLDLAGKPMLEHVVQRTSLAKSVHKVVVATTLDESDDPIVDFCQQKGIPCFRGSMFDVLDRYYQAAEIFQAQIIVRITADCPLIDPGVIDQTLSGFLGLPVNTDFSKPVHYPQLVDLPYDFAANRLPPPWGRTFPIGLDTEVCSLPALEIAWREANQKHQREHVMPFFYDQPERFRIFHLDYHTDYGKLRWTVDTPEDLQMVRQIFEYFPNQGPASWLEVLNLVHNHPELSIINQQIQPKDYRQVDQRLSDHKEE